MLLAVLAAISTFAPAEPTSAAPAAPPAATAAEKPKDDPVVCKNQVIAGSRLPVKVCSRASDDARRKRSGQDALSKIQNANGMRGPAS
jgi:hypothetical protein